MTDINFADVFALTADDAVRVAISSKGPTIILLEPTRVIISWTTDKKSTSAIQYGLTAAYGSEVGSSELVLEHKVTIAGLTPNTTYHFKVISRQSSGAKGESADGVFTTPPETGITSISITKVTYDSAVVTYTTKGAAQSILQYGETTSYGQIINGSSGDGSQTLLLDGLRSGVTYHIRIRATSSRGLESTSSDLSFTTIALPQFEVVEAVDPVPANSSQKIIHWRTNTLTTGIITYKLLTPTLDVTLDELTAGDKNLSLDHQLTLKGLVGGNKEYEYEVVAFDQGGKEVRSGKKKFSTPVDNEPPKIEKLQIATAQAGGRIIATIKWVTSEPAKGKVKYQNNAQVSDSAEIQGTDTFNQQQVIVVTDLKPSRPYTATAIATDASGNTGTAEIRFVTPKETKNIFRLIGEKIARQFGWLLNILNK